jgi:hypothetical protein
LTTAQERETILAMAIEKHKVFISYYHHDDEQYRSRFEQLFGHLFINKSVAPGDINSDLGTDYIKHLIQDGYVSDSSVVLVLVGAKTFCRKHVDWEISAGLNKKVGGYSGLLGICLPNHSDCGKDKYTPDLVPPRLVDNLKSKFAKLYDWTEKEASIVAFIQDAFDRRNADSNKIENTAPQFVKNRCD